MMKAADGTGLTRIPVAMPETVLPAPAGKAILIAREFGPDGATFSPPISIALSYSNSPLAARVIQDSIGMAHWDGSSWVNDYSKVDLAAKTVWAKVEHFTMYAVVGSELPRPAPGTTTVPALTTTPAPSPSPAQTTAPTTTPARSPDADHRVGYCAAAVPMPGTTGTGAAWVTVLGLTSGVLVVLGVLRFITMSRRKARRK